MPVRNRHRIGDWLVLDDESGRVHYASECRYVWDGSLRHHTQFETRQPQEFVKAKNDPIALTKIRPEPAFKKIDNVVFISVGETGVATKTNGPAAHLFSVELAGDDAGIGTMEIEASAESNPFTVR